MDYEGFDGVATGYRIRHVIWDAESAAHAKFSLYTVLNIDIANHLDLDVINVKADIKCNVCVYCSVYEMGCVVGWILMAFGLVSCIFGVTVSEGFDVEIHA